MAIDSLDNFAHATTSVVSCIKTVGIAELEIEWEQNKISIKF